jgi:2-oxoglutarate/2-oxoacid ferredoxin oxidoreductase subunit alpha
VTEFIHRYDQVFVVEMNRDGQMHQILTIDYPDKALSLKSVSFGDGMPATARWIREGILAKYADPTGIDGKNGKAAKTAELTPISK